MDHSLDVTINIENEPLCEPIPEIQYTNDGNVKHNYYCEYFYCTNRNSKLVPFKTSKDWTLRMLHKKCFISMTQRMSANYNEEFDFDYIRKNPLNPVFDKCKCNKLNGKPCTMKSNTEGFNKKFGYCKYHNTYKFHKIYQ